MTKRIHWESGRRVRARLALTVPAALAALAASGCSGTSSDNRTSDNGSTPEIAESTSQALTAPSIDPRASIFVTDTAIVGNFTLQAVLQQLVNQSLAQGNAGPTTPTALFQQMFATEAPPDCTADPTDTANGQFLGSGAGFAPAGSLNGWPAQCPREESAEAQNDPFDAGAPDAAPGDNGYMATTLSNRFDLASPDGSDCGEYRLNFARRSGADANDPTHNGDRLFIAFEARPPNPNPAAGLQGCMPIQQFWAGLSAMSSSARASALFGFYFNGLPSAGFGPVISINNYGARQATNGQSAGQVRINQFFFPETKIFQDWSPREFLLQSKNAVLTFVPSFDKGVAAATLFDPNSKASEAAGFQTGFFPTQVERLAVGDPNVFTGAANVPAADNIGDDQIIASSTDYTVAYDGGPSAFTTAIQGQLSSIGSTLTPEEVVTRAMSETCAGCHLKSLGPGVDFGGGISLPAGQGTPIQNGGFVQVQEATEAIPDASTPGATRFVASPIVTNTFLPYRLQYMTDFLASVPGFERNASWTSPQGGVSFVSSPVSTRTSTQALAVVPSKGYTELDSVAFSSAGLPPIQKIALDVYLPTHEPNPSWYGQVSFTITIPSARIFSQYVGPISFTGLTLGAYNTVSATLPGAVQRALGYGVTDISVEIQLNVPANTSTFYLDNLRFH